MFRFRLALVIAVALSLVLALGFSMHWSTKQIVKHFERCQAAYTAQDHYRYLSQETYRHIKYHLDRLLSDHPSDNNASESADFDLSQQRLRTAIQNLRQMAINNATHNDDDDHQHANPDTSTSELARVANLSAFLESNKYRFSEIERLIQQGNRNKAIRLLSKFSHDEIDIKFQNLIDQAIEAEREKTRRAKIELQRLAKQSNTIALAAAASAALLSLLAGIMLLRSVQRPLQELMTGTNEIASGNFTYRLDLDNNDEFGVLANHFNQMAQELAFQRDKLRLGRRMLENRIAERTVDLRKANEELKHMDIARREFFADISHELRTPITVIRGEAEVCLRGKAHDAEEYRETLQRIVELSSQLGTYVNDLLFMARAESAKMHFEWDMMDLTDLVSNAIDDLHVMAEEKSITVEMHGLDHPVWIRGDKQRLRQAIFILGDNACRYSDFNSRIQVKMKLSEHEVRFSLTDQGIGIPSEDLQRIFERRFRSSNAQHSRDDGSGLGLSMAKSIVKAHGGQIEVASIENVGSTFSITLPLPSETQFDDYPE